ncbi:MAG: nucleoside triphosphate pyrophosphohydrolase [Clostridia bacterium]|nr:nucleoside triphosphate pyrophosphohydrolase [Clostridia bacterium]
MIRILSIVHWDLLSGRAVSALENTSCRFLQSDLHPCAKSFLSKNLSYSSMDELYASAEDFEALNASIAKRLVEAGDCVYLMTGSVSPSQLAEIQRQAADAKIPVEVLPGLSLGEAAFPDKSFDARFTLHNLPARLHAEQSVVVEEIDSPLTAGELKLALSEYYPDEWPITFSVMAPSGDFQSSTIPLWMLDQQTDYNAATLIHVPGVPFDDLTRFAYEDLVDVMARLRARDGCPWDREQTHESLKQPLLEECYELLDAIDEQDDDHLIEELGDVLMQVVFHAQIAAEQGRFTTRDVSTGIVQKLVYRHPHIFSTVKVKDSAEVLANWETLKMAEKGQKTETDALRSVTKSLPALMFAKKVQKKAARVGFDWDSAEDAFYKIYEEADELKTAMEKDSNIAEEMGDLLFSVVNVARLLHLEPELLLREAADKFVDRFAKMEALVLKEGKTLSGMTLPEMDVYWDRAKAIETKA